MNKVSVVMCAYNEKLSYVKEAIDSILNQTYIYLELIIAIDNPNNSELIKLVQKYKDKDNRIKYIVNKDNIGPAHSANECIKIANGEYICRLDADDIALPTRIEKEVEFLENSSEFDIVVCDRITIDENGDIIEKRSYYVKDDNLFSDLLRYGCPITHSSIMVRRKVYKELKGYRNFKAALDYEFYLRCITSNFKIHMLNEKLIKYRINKSGITSTNIYRQIVHAEYARYLYNQRKKSNNIDDYSEKLMNKYIEKKHLFNEDFVSKFNRTYYILQDLFEKKNYFKSICIILLKPRFLSIYYNMVSYKLILKRTIND